MEKLRQLIVSVVGHVDHGKSSLLDKIRGSCIVDTEAGRITQAIGASLVPSATIQEVCGSLMKSEQLRIPGLLFIDTPGHAAFTSLRKRGGSLADMAVLVVDINEGFKPQTIEALEILKHFKTPLVVAANKIDLVPGWNSESEAVLKNQTSAALGLLDKKIYELVGSIFKLGINADRFDRVEDFSKNVAIVPVSAITGQGLPELLMVLTGLAQKFLVTRLKAEHTDVARGTVLEVKEVTGLGLVADTVLYKGCLHRNDIIIVGGLASTIQSKVKALLEPKPLCETRDKKTGFLPVQSIESAAAVRVVATDLKGVVAGMPLIGLPPGTTDLAKYEQEIMAEIQEVITDVEGRGIVVKADSLGSVEALLKMLKEKRISVKSASIGNISKRDVCDAESNLENEPLAAVVLGFNVELSKDAEELADKCSVKVLTSEVVYSLLDSYVKWHGQKLRECQQKELESLVQPCRFQVIPGYVFRESNPAIFGIDVLGGVLKLNAPVMNSTGKALSVVKSMQEEKESASEAEKGKRVALSMFKVIIGRQIQEGDVLYTGVPEEDFRKFKELKHLLTVEQKELLREIADIMRKQNAFWGV
jgi:translation initiation factor 5B